MALLPLLVLGGCAQALPLPPLPEQPTIVSLNPCADAILAEIAAPGQVLALSHYSHDPRASSLPQDVAQRYAITGGTAEEVLALAPDVVVADTFLAPSTKQALEDAGIRVEQIGITASLEDSLAQIRQLGEVSGQAAQAEALAEEIAAAWDAARVAGPQVDTLLWQSGGIVPGEGSLAFALLEQTGFASHSAARGLGQGAYLPLEQVLADPPHLVIAAGDEAMLHHPVFAQVAGVQHATLDPALLYCGGPTIPRALARLGEIRRSFTSPLPLAGGVGGGPVPASLASLAPTPNPSRQREGS